MGWTLGRTLDMGHLIVAFSPVYKANRKLTFYYLFPCSSMLEFHEPLSSRGYVFATDCMMRIVS